MSLKAFHLVFIAVSAALCLWLVGWGFAHRADPLGAPLAGCGAAGFVGLAAYLRAFVRRTRSGGNGLHPKLAIAAFAVAWAAGAARAHACTTCVGAADPGTARAFQWGILFLAALVLSTLSAIAWMMARAIRAQEAARAAEPAS